MFFLEGSVPLILAQISPSGPPGPGPLLKPSFLVVGLVGLGILFVLFGLVVAMGVRHARRERELVHAERMKALEVGRTLPQDEPWWSPARVSVAIGAGVPIVTFGLAWLTSLLTRGPDLVWPAAVVGVAGVVCGTVLALRLPVAPAVSRDSSAKPPPYPEDYEIAGREV